jgi:hypothetical protein
MWKSLGSKRARPWHRTIPKLHTLISEQLQAKHHSRHNTPIPSIVAKMSDGEVEVETPQGYPVLPKDVTSEIGTTKLFNKWSYEDVEIRDISLTYVIAPLRSGQPEERQ